MADVSAGEVIIPKTEKKELDEEPMLPLPPSPRSVLDMRLYKVTLLSTLWISDHRIK